MKVLFLCVANSARSQLAEALARKILGSSVEVMSAGSQPSGVVQPKAIEVLSEIGIEFLKAHSKAIEDIPQAFMEDLDFVVTLCAEEVCPVLPSNKARRVHWPIKDPAAVPDAEKLVAFRVARDDIAEKLKAFKLDQKI